jgi:hypothetical protein
LQRFAHGHLDSAVPLLGQAAARVIDEDLAHQTGSQGDKVAVIADLRALTHRQPQVGFVDQGGGVEAIGPATATARTDRPPLKASMYRQPV